MPIEFSKHAEERMLARGITQDDVRRALDQRVDDPEPGHPGSLWIKGYAEEWKILMVCVREDEQTYVITAAWA